MERQLSEEHRDTVELLELLENYHNLRIQESLSHPENIFTSLLLNSKGFKNIEDITKTTTESEKPQELLVLNDVIKNQKTTPKTKNTKVPIIKKKDLSANGNINPSKEKKGGQQQEVLKQTTKKTKKRGHDTIQNSAQLTPIPQDIIIKKGKKKQTKPRGKKPEANIVNPDTFFSSLHGAKFDIIVADPPWKYQMEVGSGTAANHYPCLSIEQLLRIPVDTITKPDCYLFMWTTHPMTPHVVKLMESWGFRFVTTAFIWIKVTKKGVAKIGLGQHFRGCSEIMYLGVKGRPRIHRQSRAVSSYIETDESGDINYKIGHVENIIDDIQNRWLEIVEGTITEFRKQCEDADIDTSKIDWQSLSDMLNLNFIETLKMDYPEIIVAMPTRNHSEKPMHLIIERLKTYFGTNYEKLSKLEMFARIERPGWNVMGNQVGILNTETISEPNKRRKITLFAEF